MPRPFEGNEPQTDPVETRPMPCPECHISPPRGYSRVGRFRVQCTNCNSLLKNSEVDLPDLPNEENS